MARSLVPLDGEPVWGLVSPISVSFPTRRYLHVAVNGRVVERDSFAPAVAKAYADLLPKGRHPAAFLRSELGPGEVDVNVHPAKSAVRLRGVRRTRWWSARSGQHCRSRRRAWARRRLVPMPGSGSSGSSTAGASWRKARSANPTALSFRATVSEHGAQRLELARA